MPWNGVHHVHYAIPIEKEDETIEFWTEVMGFDCKAMIDQPDGRKVITFDDGTDTHVYVFSIDFANSQHRKVEARQTPHAWLNPDDHEWIEDEIESEARDWIEGFHHLAWGVDDPDELDPIKEKLDEHDIPYRIVNRHNRSINLYFPEPVNGINLEVSSPGPNAKSTGKLSDIKYGPGDKPIETTEELDEDPTVEEEGVVRRGSRDGIARRLS